MHEMKQERCLLPFKGDRTYQQGGDLMDALRPFVNFDACSDISVSFSGMIDSNAFTMLSVVNGDLPDGKYFVRGKACRDDGEVNFAIIKDDEEDVILSPVEFDESKIIASADFSEGKAAFGVVNSDFSLMEILVALNKEMLRRTVPKDGKYLFVKIDIKKFFTPAHVMLELVSNMNNKMFRTRVSGDGAVLGDIYFTLV